jgi:hypothetical protein
MVIKKNLFLSKKCENDVTRNTHINEARRERKEVKKKK